VQAQLLGLGDGQALAVPALGRQGRGGDRFAREEGPEGLTRPVPGRAQDEGREGHGDAGLGDDRRLDRARPLGVEEGEREALADQHLPLPEDVERDHADPARDGRLERDGRRLDLGVAVRLPLGVQDVGLGHLGEERAPGGLGPGVPLEEAGVEV